MGNLLGAYVLPHPPIIVPEIGNGKEIQANKTIKGVKAVAKLISIQKPTTIIVITPHGASFSDFIYMSDGECIEGDFKNFKCDEVNLKFEIDNKLLLNVVKIANEEGIICGSLDNKILNDFHIEKKLDHGALVPLYFIKKEWKDFKILHISLADYSLVDMYRFGMCLDSALKQVDGKFVIVASGDLSHKVNEKSPYGSSKYGKEFDEFMIKSLKNNKIEDILNIDNEFCNKAAQCGLKSIVIMLGVLDTYNYKTEVNSYEAPFGIGYGVISYLDLKPNEMHSDIIKRINHRFLTEMEKIRFNEHPYVKLARKSLETYVKYKKIIDVSDDIDNYLLDNKAGVFVSIKKNGNLRGCIGTIQPQHDSIAKEIIYNAISSGTNDYRFDIVDESELENLVYSVDILKEPVKIDSLAELNVEKYGVIVRYQNKSGLLLPNLAGIDTPQMQIDIALEKAGIDENNNYSMEKFEVVRYRTI